MTHGFSLLHCSCRSVLGSRPTDRRKQISVVVLLFFAVWVGKKKKINKKTKKTKKKMMALVTILLVGLSVHSFTSSEDVMREDNNRCLDDITTNGLRTSPQTYYMAVENSCNSTVQEMKRLGTPIHLVPEKDLGEEFGKYLAGNTYSLVEEILSKKLSAVEILSLDSSWVSGLAKYLMPLENKDKIESLLNKKYLTYSGDDVIGIAEHADQQIFYYNRKVFDYLGEEFPTTWEKMSETLLRINETGFFNIPMGIPFSDKSDVLCSAATLLSSFTSKPLVSSNRSITADISAVNLAFDMLKDWKTSGLLKFQQTQSETLSDLQNGKIAVALLWTSSSVQIDQFLEIISTPGLIKAAPIPENGFGAKKHRTVSLNAHMRIGVVSPAHKFVELHAEHTLPRSNLFDMVGSLPLWNPLRNDLYLKQYCSKHTVLCEALEMYPEFFESVAEPLTSGCGDLHLVCEDIIYRRLKEMFDDVPLPSDLGTTLHDDLYKVIVGYSGDEVYTPYSFTCILSQKSMAWISASMLLLVVLLLFAYVRKSVSPLKVKGKHVPMPVLLSIVVAVSLMVLTIAIVETVNTATNDITLTMSSKIAQLYLSSVDSSVSLSIDGIRTSKLTTHQAMLQANSHLRHGIQRMNARLNRRPLIVAVDTKTGLITFSSDETIQEDNVLPSHAWVVSALETAKSPTGEYLPATDPLHLITLNTETGTLFVNRQIVRTGGIQFDHITLIVLCITSKHEIMLQSNDTYEEGIYFGSFFSSFGILVVALVSIAVSVTLIPLAIEISNVANKLKFPTRNRMENATSNILLEVSALDIAFSGLCRSLTEYKRFMPSSLLNESFIKSNRSSTTSESVLLLDDMGTTSDDFLSRMMLCGNKPPTGNVAVVFTDVESSSPLWEYCQKTMRECLSMHDSILRHNLESSVSGYEVKTIGDSFLCAFQSAVEAVEWSFTVQYGLLNCSWPDTLTKHPMSNLLATKQGIWNGLRVRAGIHYGKVEVEESIITGRADYFGTTINLATRIEAAAVGGGIGVSDVVMAALNSRNSSKLPRERRHYVVSSAHLYLRGIEGVTVVSMLVPYGLRDRSAELDKKFKLLHAIQNPLQTTISTDLSDVDRSSLSIRSDSVVYDETSIPQSLQDHFTTSPASSASILADYKPLNSVMSSSRTRHFISALISSCATAASRCSGSVHSACGNMISVSWGATHKDAYHLYNSIRFVDLLSRKSSKDGKYDVNTSIDNISIGICSDIVVNGNVGKSERFNVLLAAGLSLSSELAVAAKQVGVVCLTATLLEDVQLHNANLFKSLFIGTIFRVLDSIKVTTSSATRLVHIYQLRHTRLLPPHSVDSSEFDVESHTWSSHNDAYFCGEGFLHEDPILTRITQIKRAKKHIVQFPKGVSRSSKKRGK